jgi:hypothetical protein
MKNFSTQLSGQIGENLLVAELGRRGIVATSFAGNVPDIDVLAYSNGKSIPIQVKALRKGSLSVNAGHYLDIVFDDKKQIINGLNSDINRQLIFVIVAIGDQLGDDTFYICKQGHIQDVIFNNHSGFLKKHNGIRPKQPNSLHCAYGIKDLLEMKDNWALIERALLAQQ